MKKITLLFALLAVCLCGFAEDEVENFTSQDGLFYCTVLTDGNGNPIQAVSIIADENAEYTGELVIPRTVTNGVNNQEYIVKKIG